MDAARSFAATVIFAGLALGLAAACAGEKPNPAPAPSSSPSSITSGTPAHTMSGHYVKTETNSAGHAVEDDWYVTPCGDGCVNVNMVGRNGGNQTSSQARFINGQWAMDVTNLADICIDGNRDPAVVASAHYSWDPNTLAGTGQVTYNTTERCGQSGMQTNYTDTIQLRQAP